MGWTAQLALGVAYWILPRFHSERRREAWAALASGLLNAGILVVSVAVLWGQGVPWLTAGRALETAAALAFAWHAWPRVKPMAA